MADNTLHIIEIAIVLALLVSLIVGGIRHATKLKASEQLWKFALEGAGDGVWDWDIENDIAHLSGRYKEMFGFSDDDIKTSSLAWNNRIHPNDVVSMNEAVNNYLTGKSQKYIHEHRIICKDKSIKWVLSRGMIVKRDGHGKPVRMVGTHADITGRKLLESKLENLAHFDSLSNLPNRTLLNDRLKLALAYAKREKKLLAVMFIDLDQ
ncbi:MAG TPA: PAS domain-containing protein, partial [Methylotenera sp.]|nr:PAS domain-containing protein [Methylotenera sp.]